MPHFTLTAALAGAIPGFVYRTIDRRRAKGITRTRVAVVVAHYLSVGVSGLLVSLGLTPYFLNTRVRASRYEALIPARAAAVASKSRSTRYLYEPL